MIFWFRMSWIFLDDDDDDVFFTLISDAPASEPSRSYSSFCKSMDSRC